MSIPFLVVSAVSFILLVAVAERWSILAAGAVVLVLAVLLGCAP